METKTFDDIARECPYRFIGTTKCIHEARDFEDGPHECKCQLCPLPISTLTATGTIDPISWTSEIAYEHPSPDMAGRFGHIVLHTSGVYTHRDAGQSRPIPQDFAVKIHEFEKSIMLEK